MASHPWICVLISFAKGGNFPVLIEDMSTVPRFIPSFSRILKLGQNLNWAIILFPSDTLVLFGWVGRNLESDGIPRVLKT